MVLTRQVVIYRLFFADSYLWHVVRFTFFGEAFFIRAIFHFTGNLVGKSALSTPVCWQNALFTLMCNEFSSTGVSVALFGILTVYGRMGWLAQICQWLGIDYHFTPYGLQGILLAHIFFQYATGYQNVVTKPWKVFLPSNAN